MPPPQRDRPLNDAECARLDAVLSRFGSEYAMNNLEEIDGFFAALICSPDVAKPSEYLPEIWGGGEMADDEAFADQPDNPREDPWVVMGSRAEELIRMEPAATFVSAPKKHVRYRPERLKTREPYFPLFLAKPSFCPQKCKIRR